MKKYCRPLLAGLTLFFAANPLTAQPPQLVIDTSTGWKPDTVSVEEMKRSFHDWLRGKPQKPEAVSERFISGDALFRVAATDADLSKDRQDFYLDSPKLQELISPFSPALPPSLWEPSSLYVGRTGLTKPVYLEWKGPRPYYSRGVDQEALKQKVKELSHGTATWFTGPISLSSYTTAVRYCNNYITTTAKVFEVEKGKFVGGPYKVSGKYGKYARQSLSADPYPLELGREELTAFADELQQQLPPDAQPAKGRTVADLSFLLTTDAAGKAHLHLLWPENLPREAWTTVDQLSEAVEALPAGRFGYFLATDGRIFPGRYLKFRYDDGQGRWHVTDYLRDTRRPTDSPKGTAEWDYAQNERQ